MAPNSCRAMKSKSRTKKLKKSFSVGLSLQNEFKQAPVGLYHPQLTQTCQPYTAVVYIALVIMAITLQGMPR